MADMKTKLHKEIMVMKSDQLVNTLKQKGLPVFGTMQQKKERLKSYYGIDTQTTTAAKKAATAMAKKDSTRAAIDKINQNRETRRRRMEEKKKVKLQREVNNLEMGIKWDVDFQLMVEHEKSKVTSANPHSIPDLGKVNICVRKRPLFKKEAEKGEIDCVSCTNPAILVHKWKFKVDGITKYVDNLGFEFDNTFSEFESSDSLYYSSIQPQIDFLFDGGIVTCFAYGQTGSGKTYTMDGVQRLAVNDFFAGAEIMKEETGKLFTFTVSYFEIYNGKVFDLLDNHKQKKVQEDRTGSIKIPGLKEVQARSVDEMTQLIEYGLSERKTKSTACNDTSSRSHAIGTISIKEINKKNQVISESGKLLLVDLAGSEKAQDSQSNNRQRRIEGAEINTSLLSLKECIRAIDSSKKHIPFRQSKLTMVLRDSFIGGKNKNHIIMIACISPNHSSSDHTCNTLRYAERLKWGTDEEEPVEKYMASKPIMNKSQEFNFHYEDKYDDNDEIYEEPVSQVYKDPRLYQSQDFALCMNDHFNQKVSTYEDEMRVGKEQMFVDTTNFIELNPSSSREFEHVDESKYQPEMSKTIEPKTVYTYEPQEDTNTHHHQKSAYTNLDFNYESQPRRNKINNNKYQSYRKVYVGNSSENEDELMQVDSDHSDEHNSPQTYISKNNETSFSKQHKLRNNAKNAQLDLQHSGSSSRLWYKKEIKPSRMNYSKDNTNSSTSNIGKSHIINFSSDNKPVSASLSHHDRLGGSRRYEASNKHESTPASSLSDRYRKLVSTSSYGKALVTSYNSYFKKDLGKHLRPTTATLDKKYK